MNKLHNPELLSYLQNLKIAVVNNLQDGPIKFHAGVGICNNRNRPPNSRELLATLISGWPKSTGSRQFPVPCPGVPPQDKDYGKYLSRVNRAASRYRNSRNHWEGDYGALRMELLEWLINELS